MSDDQDWIGDFMGSFHARAGNVFERDDVIKCEKHGDTPTKVYRAPDGSMIGLKCPECLQEAEREREVEEARIDAAERAKRRIEQSINGAMIPERFKSRTLGNYVADSGEKQSAVLEFCRQYAANFDKALELGTSLIFSGGVGTGKTHLSIGIAHEIMTSGYTAVFSTVSGMVRHIRSTWRSEEENELDAMRSYVMPNLLILDEVGVQSGSDNEHQILFEILNSRYERCRPTILLTNLPIRDQVDNGIVIKKGLQSFIGDRLLDRMREGGGKAFTFDWQSGRIGR